MHNHDLDTIAALADGSLDLDHQDEVRHLLENCEECREEFEAQTMILGILSETETTTLSDFERARLHQSIARLELEPVGRTGRQSAWFNWMPRVAVAAALIAFVGTFGVLFFDNQAADFASSEAASATEAPQELAATAEAAAPLQAEEAAELADDSAAADGVEARSEDETLYTDIGELRDLEELSVAVLDRFVLQTQSLDLAQTSEFSCLRDAQAFGLTTIGAAATLDGDPVEVFVIDEEYVIVLALDGCEALSFPGTGPN